MRLSIRHHRHLLLPHRRRRGPAPLPPSDPAHGCIACCLGAACFELRHFALAAALFGRALCARSAGSDCHVLDVALALHNWAASVDCRGARGDAFVLFRRAETLMRSAVEPSHPRMEVLLGNMRRQHAVSYHQS